MCNLTCFSAFVLKIILGMIFIFMGKGELATKSNKTDFVASNIYSTARFALIGVYVIDLLGLEFHLTFLCKVFAEEYFQA